MARVGDGPSFRRPTSAAAAVAATMDDLQQRASAPASPPKAKRSGGKASKAKAKTEKPAAPPETSAGERFEADLVQVAVMFRPGVLSALEQAVKDRRAGGSRVGLAALVRAALEGLPADAAAVVENARQERAVVREAGEEGRGVERNIRIYAHQRTRLERATALLDARRIAGAQSLLVNGAVRAMLDDGDGAITAALTGVESRREEAAFSAALAA